MSGKSVYLVPGIHQTLLGIEQILCSGGISAATAEKPRRNEALRSDDNIRKFRYQTGHAAPIRVRSGAGQEAALTENHQPQQDACNKSKYELHLHIPPP